MALINKHIRVEEQYLHCDKCGHEVKCHGEEMMELLTGAYHWHLYETIAVCDKCTKEIIMNYFGNPQELPFDDEVDETTRMHTGLTPMEIEALMTAGTEDDSKPELEGTLDYVPF